MWIRSVLKDNAKTNLRSKYWTALGVTILVGIISSAFSGIVSNIIPSYDMTTINYNLQSLDELISYFSILLPGMLVGFVVSVALGLLFSVFVVSVLQVGQVRWFSRNRESTATPSVGIIFSLFKGSSYLKTVGSMLWRNLFLFLWSLPGTVIYIFGVGYLFVNGFQNFTLYMQGQRTSAELLVLNDNMTELLISFIIMMLAALMLTIPYLIKTYSYKLTPWILADNPQIGFRRALKLSMALARGYKWQIFVLDLSFIGWYVLGFLACCIGTLFVAPYYLAAQAELYANLRQNGVALNLCSMEELGFIAATPEELPQPSSEF